MKGSTIAVATFGTFQLGLAVLKFAANRHARKAMAEKAVQSRTEEIKEALDLAEQNCELFKKLSAKEKKEFEHQVKNWKISHEFDLRKIEFLDSAKAGLDEFKNEIGYFNTIDELEDGFDAAVEAFKQSIGYDDEKDKLEALIEEAKNHYESQKAAFDLAGDDISDTTMKLRHAAEEAMTVKVKEAKSKLDSLEKQLTEETEKLTKKKQADIRTLEEKVAKEKIRLDKKADRDLEKLNDELSKAQDDIRKKIRKARTEEEKIAFASHEEDIRLIREQQSADNKLARELFDEMTPDLKMAEYFRFKKIPKTVVAILSALPLVPVTYLSMLYIHFVRKVIVAM